MRSTTGVMFFYNRSVAAFFAVSTFLAPAQLIQAQEKACAAATEVSDVGQIIWNKSPDVADLVGDAQK